MPWSWPTQRGVLVALTVAIGTSNARIGGAVGSAAGAAEADWPAPPAAGWPLGGAGDGAAAGGRAAGALGAVQASNAKTSPTAAQRSQRTTRSLLGRSGRAPEGPNPPAPLPSEGRGERTDRSPLGSPRQGGHAPPRPPTLTEPPTAPALWNASIIRAGRHYGARACHAAQPPARFLQPSTRPTSGPPACSPALGSR